MGEKADFSHMFAHVFSVPLSPRGSVLSSPRLPGAWADTHVDYTPTGTFDGEIYVNHTSNGSSDVETRYHHTSTTRLPAALTLIKHTPLHATCSGPFVFYPTRQSTKQYTEQRVGVRG